MKRTNNMIAGLLGLALAVPVFSVSALADSNDKTDKWQTWNQDQSWDDDKKGHKNKKGHNAKKDHDDKNDWDKNGWDKNGWDKDGRDKDGRDKDGWSDYRNNRTQVDKSYSDDRQDALQAWQQGEFDSRGQLFWDGQNDSWTSSDERRDDRVEFWRNLDHDKDSNRQ